MRRGWRPSSRSGARRGRRRPSPSAITNGRAKVTGLVDDLKGGGDIGQRPDLDSLIGKVTGPIEAQRGSRRTLCSTQFA